jgi:hypothetical protein
MRRGSIIPFPFPFPFPALAPHQRVPVYHVILDVLDQEFNMGKAQLQSSPFDSNEYSQFHRQQPSADDPSSAPLPDDSQEGPWFSG